MNDAIAVMIAAYFNHDMISPILCPGISGGLTRNQSTSMVPFIRGQSVGKGSVGSSQLELPKISLRLSSLDGRAKGFWV